MRMRWNCLLERLPSGPIVGAEVGVLYGEMSAKLLERNDLTLYMVDSRTNDRLPTVLARFPERAKFLHMPSLEAAKQIPDGSLDFVFIDADHTLPGVSSDWDAWKPKVKPGGLLCGHDYTGHSSTANMVRHFIDGRIAEGKEVFELDDDETWFTRI